MENSPVQIWLAHCLAIIIASLSFSFAAIAGDDQQAASVKIEKAKYSVEKHQLKVKVKLKGEKPFALALFDADTGRLLLEKKAGKIRWHWK